jgi:hypothetical protein
MCLFFFIYLSYYLVYYLSIGTSDHLLVPFIMDFLALIGLLYKEDWLFDNGNRQVVARFGVFPFVSRRSVPYDEINTLEVTHFIKGTYEKEKKEDRKHRRYRAYLKFGIRLSDDELLLIEAVAEHRSAGHSESCAAKISSFTGLPLYVDRPRDMDLHVGFRDL